MQKSEFCKILKKLVLAYPAFDLTDEQVKFWAEMFRGYTSDELDAAVIEYVETSPYVPTIASLMRIIKENRTEMRMYKPLRAGH